MVPPAPPDAVIVVLTQ
jgi:hypothetical protein